MSPLYISYHHAAWNLQIRHFDDEHNKAVVSNFVAHLGEEFPFPNESDSQ